MLASVLAFTAVAFFIVLTPGADTVLVLRTSVRSGVRAGTLAAAGVVCGPVIWGALAGVGVALVVRQNPILYTVIAAAGGGYLCYLAYQSIVAAVRAWRSTGAVHETRTNEGENTTGKSLPHFGRGLVTNLLNPQIGVFYLAIMPGLFDAGQITLWLGAALGGIHGVLGLVFLSVIAFFTSATNRLLDRPKVTASVEFVCGLLLLGFGVYASAEAALSLQ